MIAHVASLGLALLALMGTAAGDIVTPGASPIWIYVQDLSCPVGAALIHLLTIHAPIHACTKQPCSLASCCLSMLKQLPLDQLSRSTPSDSGMHMRRWPVAVLA